MKRAVCENERPGVGSKGVLIKLLVGSALPEKRKLLFNGFARRRDGVMICFKARAKKWPQLRPLG